MAEKLKSCILCKRARARTHTHTIKGQSQHCFQCTLLHRTGLIGSYTEHQRTQCNTARVLQQLLCTGGGLVRVRVRVRVQVRMDGSGFVPALTLHLVPIWGLCSPPCQPGLLVNTRGDRSAY